MKDKSLKNIDARRVLRGGAWYGDLRLARLSYRFDLHPDYVFVDIGFRVVRSSPSGKERKGKDDER